MEALDRATINQNQRPKVSPIWALARATYLDNQQAFSLVTVTWILGLWVFQFQNGNLIPLVCFGIVYSLIIAPSLAGNNTQDGSEEYSFSLPISKAQYFWTRFLVGFIPLSFFIFVGIFAITNDFPQKIWSLLLDSGFNSQPYSQRLNDQSLRFLLTIPFSLYLSIHACVSLTPNGSSTLYPFLVSLSGPGTILFIVFVIANYSEENLRETNLNSAFSLGNPLIIISIVIFFVSYQLFKTKEINDKSPLRKISITFILLIITLFAFVA